jgi:hypothetical protein
VKLSIAIAAFLAAICAAVAGAQGTARVDGLRLIEVRTPPIPAPRYETKGTYPQVARRGMDLRAVNRTISHVLLSEQHHYARGAIQEMREVSSPPEWLGLYETWTKPELTLASTRVVSTLIPVRELYPGGNDGDTWVSATVLVPSGRRLIVRDLFASSHRGLRALAGEFSQRLLAANECVKESIANAPDDYIRKSMLSGFKPVSRNYRYFALTPRGLVIGFPLGQVSSPPCGRVRAAIPYAALDQYWSPLARRLIAGVRAPR